MAQSPYGHERGPGERPPVGADPVASYITEQFQRYPHFGAFTLLHAHHMADGMVTEAMALPSLLTTLGHSRNRVRAADPGIRDIDQELAAYTGLRMSLRETVSLFTRPNNTHDTALEAFPVLLSALYKQVGWKLPRLPGAVSAYTRQAWLYLRPDEPSEAVIPPGFSNADRFRGVFNRVFSAEHFPTIPV